MHAPRRFKKAFMERLLLSLQVAGLTSKSMGLRERRDAVRLSSDVAMASARGRAAPWARALVARHAAERRNEPLLRRIMGGDGYDRAAAAAAGGGGRKEARSRGIVRRSQRVCSSRRKRRSLQAMASGAGALSARRMVRCRLRLLRRLVPGGEALRGFSLLSETLDYVVCLKAQVELMQSLCKGSQQQQQKLQLAAAAAGMKC
ncbi:transcription factor IBH1-like 1 [Oryza brachyantha]|uniref:transcription factor IBH1-like 1 n=1 Tax=Oryza brachyantha TaxID=4533 RepID=UPI001ADBC18A|nr:transcription factor IBH1-like 1 [Oryza brachyantha]